MGVWKLGEQAGKLFGRDQLLGDPAAALDRDQLIGREPAQASGEPRDLSVIADRAIDRRNGAEIQAGGGGQVGHGAA